MMWLVSVGLSLGLISLIALVVGVVRFHDPEARAAFKLCWRASGLGSALIFAFLAADLVRFFA